MTYPVQIDVTSPPRFDRIQLVLRLAISIALGWVASFTGWLPGLVFFVLPVFAATVVSTRGATAYTEDLGLRLWRVLRWLLAFSAYMMLLVDRFPAGDPAAEPNRVRADLQVDARPTTASALLRLVTSIPSALVLCLLAFVSSVLTLVGAITVLIDNHVPARILAFQRGMLRWQARLVGYHASLVDEYPPFSFDDGDSRPPDRASAL